jgi:uncharacterized secreted protein with C-terminal beta-propeller domain
MKPKYLCAVGLIILLFFGFNLNVQAAHPKVIFNGTEMLWGEFEPILENDRMLVPIRPIADALNCNLIFDEIGQKVTLEKSNNVIEIVMGEKIAHKNNQELLLDVSPKIIGDLAYVPLRFLVESLEASINWDEVNQIVNIETSSNDNYATVQSDEDLKRILSEFNYNRQQLKAMEVPSISNSSVASDATAGATASAPRFSETNIQVTGIDESDIVKTDGKYIYQIRGDLVTISEVYPTDNMKLLRNIDFSDNNFIPNELYVDEYHLIVMGTSYKSNLIDQQSNISTIDPKISIMPDRIMPPYYGGTSISKISIFNITDKNNIIPEREIEIEGNYISSRKIGNYVYFITNKYAVYDNGDVRPLFSDSANQAELKPIDYNNIHYFPNYVSPNFISIMAIDLEGSDKQVKLETYLGSSDNIYMSNNSLYIAQSPDYNETTIFKFNIDKDVISYINNGIVKGHILNQFSMDEFDDSFRIATTSWNNSSNNIFVLDDQMKTIGKLTGLAPNERIYSVRFMGEKVYLVTFEQTDPLFVIDLANKSEPKILGELVIPGFSNYLHPLDSNHILGIGKDTSVIEENNFRRVKQDGIKLAIFDVSDVNKPVQESVQVIGNSGTYSEALYNHKAILFDSENNLLALPINLVKYNGQTYNETQSVFVFDVNVNKGINIKGQISHSDNYYSQNSRIQRSLYINDILYTVSNNKIMANLITNLQHIASLQIN